jgi:dTDP-4-dehydrorhamnose reductase
MLINILVTGSNGQLGMELQSLALENRNFNFIFTTKDTLAIENESVVHYFFEKYNPTYCINCAAYTAVDKAESEKELAYQINVTGVENIAKACLQFNTKLIHISTDYVFDGSKKQPYIENDSTNPINYYGVTKLLGEEVVQKNSKEFIIIRTSWVYSSYGNNFVKTMIKLMQSKESINVINDQIGSPTYAKSLAKVILNIINELENKLIAINGIYNYSSDAIISWYDFANEIKKLSKSNCIINPIATVNYPTPAMRSLYSVLSKEKIVQTFGVEFANWKTELKECIDLIGAENNKYLTSN